MTDPEITEVRSQLSAALALSPAARDSFLQERVGMDDHVRAEVASLLSLQSFAEGFLDTAVPELLGANVASEQLLTGVRINDRYLLDSVIASGGFGTVYSARDQRLGDRLVVVKVLDRICDPTAIQAAFRNELQVLSVLNHPALVGISDVGELDCGTPFLVLPFIPGRTMREMIADGPMPPARARNLIFQTARALAAAHKLGIVHLDVKPENIVISDPGTPDERVTLVDFGIARLRQLEPGLPQAGSERYMAPEQPAAPGPLCDVFSLGIVACELLSGSPPKQSAPFDSKIASAHWARSLSRAIDPDAASRFRSAAEFARAISAPVFNRRRFAWTAAALALCLAIGGALVYREHQQPAEFYSKSIPFTTTLASEFEPSFSPDGKWVYYVTGSDGRSGIFRKSSAGGEPEAVVPPGAAAAHPHVSPDGRWLGYILNPEAHVSTIVRVALEGGRGETTLGPGRNIESWDWSADGTQLVASVLLEGSQRQGLSVLDLATRQWSDLLVPGTDEHGYYAPALSPDGKWLACLKRRADTAASEVILLPVNSRLSPAGPIRQLTAGGLRLGMPQWTPDSTGLLYLGGTLARHELWRVSLDGGAPHTVPGVSRQIREFAIARNSWKIGMTVDLSDSNIWRLDLKRQTATIFFASTYDDESASHSPDGSLIAFVSERTGSPQVWVTDAAGANPIQITDFPSADVVDGIWSPDSKSLIISLRSAREGKRIYTAPIAVRPALSLLIPDGLATSLSRDGKRLYFVRQMKDTRRLWVADYPDALHPKPVTEGESYFGVEAPDGKSVYFSMRHEDKGLWVQALPSGRARRIVDRLHRRNLFQAADHGLYYVAPDPNDAARHSLFSLPYGGQKAAKRFTFSRTVGWGLDISKDERTLLFSQFDLGNTDIELIHSFR